MSRTITVTDTTKCMKMWPIQVTLDLSCNPIVLYRNHFDPMCCSFPYDIVITNRPEAQGKLSLYDVHLRQIGSEILTREAPLTRITYRSIKKINGPYS